jgi:trehalose 6-phosphate phosphatase
MSAGTSVPEQAARLVERAQKVALCLDFDGTLSPIVEDPQAARPLPGIVELLGPLAERFAAVALVSGRPAAYLAEHAAARGVRYLGLYGLQEIREGQLRVDPRLKAARPAVLAAGKALRNAPAVRDSGAWLEDKEYAVAVHTRRLADPGQWASPIDQAARKIAGQYALEVIPGKLVWELRPPVRRDKGDAVRRVVAESGARDVVVVGDDLGDLPAFSAVAQLAGQGHKGLRVAVRSEGRRAVPAAVLAPGNPGRARLAGSVDHAAALVGSMVERAPGPPAASADDIPRGRLRPAPLHPELTTTARIGSPAAARRGSRGGARTRAAYSPGRKAVRRPRPLPARSARRSCSRTAC